MSDVVERVKAALEALGDKGPWTIDSEDGEPIIHEAHHYDSTDEWYDVDGANGGWVAHCEDLPVAEFIAQARTLVPELVAEVERLRAQETRIRELAERVAEVRAWSEPDGPTCDEANALNALGEDILAALDTEGEQ
ncbi:hypothetical protein SEA_MAHAVRAT_77 [Mycobacterium phage Mahavrat]|uniref:Uncharacterized protein n=1 Tax=Mycobacterium phage Mahavrat TaxID=2591129 RepID=A0A515MLD4_9CAUD|nr:hypothetical protein I5H59_gp77 [Mycobacterium phage Mahavrat]QDM57461.1 hypothetical protein SEA_MAHAVRAT_77 [Mycobacterium phage Mahavrat]